MKPTCARIGGCIPNGACCVYCGAVSREARDRMAALITQLQPKPRRFTLRRHTPEEGA